MKVDREFYKNEYHSNKEIENFEQLELIARKTVDRYTFNRIKEITDENIIFDYKLCICEMIDLENILADNNGKTVKSESVGKHSVTYSGVADKRSELTSQKVSVIRKYLGNYGLLYRGVSI